MGDIRISREGPIDILEPVGEYDVSNVEEIDEALRECLSDDTGSCLLDLGSMTFLDSSVVHALVRWSKETQLSEREALAILVGSETTPAARVLGLVGLLKRLPVFPSRETAILALSEGRRPRSERAIKWLTDAELEAERAHAESESERAGQRLSEVLAEQERRRQASD